MATAFLCGATCTWTNRQEGLARSHGPELQVLQCQHPLIDALIRADITARRLRRKLQSKHETMQHRPCRDIRAWQRRRIWIPQAHPWTLQLSSLSCLPGATHGSHPRGGASPAARAGFKPELTWLVLRIRIRGNIHDANVRRQLSFLSLIGFFVQSGDLLSASSLTSKLAGSTSA